MGLNLLAYGNQISVLFAVLSPILATVAVILLDAIVAIITRALPKDWLSPYGSAFSVSMSKGNTVTSSLRSSSDIKFFPIKPFAPVTRIFINNKCANIIIC